MTRRSYLRHVCAILCAIAVAFCCGAARAATPAEVAAKALNKCQKAILKNGSSFLETKLKSLRKCTDAIFGCIQTKPGVQKCIDAARKKCTKNLATILNAEGQFANAIVKACADVSVDDLTAEGSLGYALNAIHCLPDFGADVSTRDGIVTCIVRQHARAAERLFALQQARTVRLLEFARVSRVTLCDVPANLDCDGCAVTNPPERGKAIARCAAKLAKAGSAYAVKLTTLMTKCAKATFACTTTPATPAEEGECREKATAVCTKAFNDLPGERDDLDATFASNKKCNEVPFSVLADVAALNLSALAPVCAAAGTGIGSLQEYARCLRQQHECGVQDLAPFAVPRIIELLGDVGIPDPLCTEPVPLTVARIAEPLLAAAAGGSDTTDIIRSINSPGGGTGDSTPGGFKPPTMGASNAVSGVEGSVVFRPGRPKPIKIAYSRCADPNITPALLVSVKDENDALLPGFFELPLPGVAGEENEADVEVTFQPDVAGCVRLAFATDCGAGGVSAYVRFEQVPNVDPKETSTPTTTPTLTPSVTVVTPAVTPSPTMTLTPSATGATTPTETSTPTETPTATATPTPTGTLTATVTRTPTETPTLTATSTPGPTTTSTQTTTPSATKTPTPTFTKTLSTTPTPTPSASTTSTETPSPSTTPTVTRTPTPIPTVTATPTQTASRTATALPTVTPTATITATRTPTPTFTTTRTPTPTLTTTRTPTPTLTTTRTPTPTLTATRTVTPTLTVSPTPTRTATRTATPTPTPGSCCVNNTGLPPGCNNSTCQNCVCGLDSFCCNNTWDGQCAAEAANQCAASCPQCVPTPTRTPTPTPTPTPGSCCVNNTGLPPGCNNSTCQNCVCGLDSFCCNNTWDGQCAAEAANQCAASCPQCVPTPPVIFNGSHSVILVNDPSCPFPTPTPGPTPGATVGTRFLLEFDFTDVNGDVVTPGAAVKEVSPPLPDTNLQTFSITGTGFAGRIAAHICIRFNQSNSATSNIVLEDAAGNRSNTIAIVIPKPLGAN